jgi:two-component system OmpR family response regulator
MASSTPANSARILVVDDEPSIRELLVASLKFSGFAVIEAANGNTALRIAAEAKPDLIVLDVMLPDQDGFTVARTLRARGDHTPIMFLTAKDEVTDKVRGFKMGGDDYLTKPFSLEEVVARIHAILRRTANGLPDDADDIIQVGDLSLNEDTYEVKRAGVVIDLSPTEFRLLEYLMENAGRVVSKEQILDRVWNYNWSGEANIVESYISYLRRKIDNLILPDADKPLPAMIHTKRGIGYILRAAE